MRRILLGLALVLVPPSAYAADNITIALDGFRTCVDRFPETRETVGVLKAQGWRYEGIFDKFHIYSQNGRRILAATAVKSHSQQGCMVAVSKMTADQAKAAAAGFLKGRRNVVEVDPAEADPDAVAAWVFEANGHKVGLAAMNPGDFHFMRGAGLLLVAIE